MIFMDEKQAIAAGLIPGVKDKTTRKARKKECSNCGLIHRGISALECEFIEAWRMYSDADAPGYTKEYSFHDERQWRFDFAFPDSRVAVEIDGGTATNGRHVRPQGYEDDCHKLNAATQEGWRILRYTSSMISSNPIGTVEQILRAIRGQRENSDISSHQPQRRRQVAGNNAGRATRRRSVRKGTD